MKKMQSIPECLRINDPHAWRGMKGRIFALLQFACFVKNRFMAHQSQLRAGALTYTTVLSMIPFLAIAFSVLKGLGVQNSLEPLLVNLAGDSEETVARIIQYVNNTNVKSLGAIGLLTLVMTVVSLLGSIEDAFNASWGVQENRPFQRRFSDYLSVVIVGPILILVATSMTSSLQSQWLVQWLLKNSYFGDLFLFLFRLLPYVSIWIAMTFLYVFIPNTRVKLPSAMIGGVLAGTVWQIAQWGYFHFQVGVANYNAIYGTLAALPIFLVWVYTSWLIVLLGVEVVSAHQLHGIDINSLNPPPDSADALEKLSLAVMIQVCSHFKGSGAPPSAELLAQELGLPLKWLDPVFVYLEKHGFLVSTSANPPCWLPGRDPGLLTVLELVTVLRNSGERIDCSTDVLQMAERVIKRSCDGMGQALGSLTLSDLLAGTEQGGQAL